MSSHGYFASPARPPSTRHPRRPTSRLWAVGAVTGVLMIAALVFANLLLALAGLFAAMLVVTDELGRKIARDAESACPGNKGFGT